MNINSINSNQNFRALKLNPAKSDWNKKVLDAALESKYVRTFVERGAKNKEDVTMSLSDFVPDRNNWYYFRLMNFELKSTSQSVSMKSVARPVESDHNIIFKDVNTDELKDVATDLASQLRSYGVVDHELSTDEKLRKLEQIADFKN